jgi:DNA helicase-2/ATP-dependent DNA helicase PcrA
VADTDDPFADETVPWRKCEIAWGRWLEATGHFVEAYCERTDRYPGTRAPLFSHQGKMWRAPDFSAVKNGTTQYWEVKYRTVAGIDPVTSEREHWMSYASFSDYLAIANLTKYKLKIVLYEAPAANTPGRWLTIDIHHLRVAGRKEMRRGDDGVLIEAMVWSRRAMELIDGPDLDFGPGEIEPLPDEGDGERFDDPDLVDMERLIRRESREGKPPEPAEASDLRMLLESERQASLSVLSKNLGLPHAPRYSVMRIGLEGVDLDDLLGFMQYGIRVFLVSERDIDSVTANPEYAPYLDSRLLETAVAPSAAGVGTWIVDGRFSQPEPDELTAALEEADAHGGINVLQYRIVHAPHGRDVRVTAGAGTGKTETMSERVMFLLSTFSAQEGLDSEAPRPYDLRMDDIVMVTFTREAAREMRERIARTLMLRQRLCRRCVLPVLAWMMQLSSTQISTIHAFAKTVAQQGGANLGIGPSFRVSPQTLVFREIVLQALSGPFGDAIAAHGKQVPRNHLWFKHIQEVWSTLDNAGVPLLDMKAGGKVDIDVDWGGTDFGDFRDFVSSAIEDIIEEVSEKFAEACRENQAVPTSQLVTLALDCLRSQEHPPVRPPRFLFIDEFQDTDSQQMDFMLELRRRMEARLFVVGDVKQGIYRFRGAEGNAFLELDKRLTQAERDDLNCFGLTRNFRSGQHLLESLHPYFAQWGQGEPRERLLDYGPGDELRHARHKAGGGLSIDNRPVDRWTFAREAAQQVKRWRKEDAKDQARKIAVLCRYNKQAMSVQKAVRALGLQCDLVSKGEFFSTPAVKEVRVLLEAVNNPNDTAALLELLETRWASGIASGTAPTGVVAADQTHWGAEMGEVLPWEARWDGMEQTGSFVTNDLDVLRERVRSLRRMLDGMSLMGWITECARTFGPELCVMPDDDDEGRERQRYTRCLGHLLMKMDTEFGESAVTLVHALEWLNIQIATNDSEDEPFDEDDLEGVTVAITVHKSKGLEFDCVLIPNTWQEWGTVPGAESHATILRDENDPDGMPKLGWKWRGEPDKPDEFSNMDPNSDAAKEFWDEDVFETMREETRLLYVALTRARDHLVVFRQETDSGASWGTLLAMGEGS